MNLPEIAPRGRPLILVCRWRLVLLLIAALCEKQKQQGFDNALPLLFG
jgi:hypothetical protein